MPQDDFYPGTGAATANGERKWVVVPVPISHGLLHGNGFHSNVAILVISKTHEREATRGAYSYVCAWLVISVVGNTADQCINPQTGCALIINAVAVALTLATGDLSSA